jgi:S-formylglutathione hydrolase FrmB
MAYVSTSIYVPEAGTSINVELVFPDDGRLVDGATDVKGVITLLHGFYGCSSDWTRLSAAARYAYDKGYILICPGAGNSFYHNMVYGPPYYDIMTKYLSRELRKIFRIPAERERNHIAGLSMGGYGAMRVGLLNPDLYATIGSFSGALDVVALTELFKLTPPEARGFVTPIFGDSFSVPDEANLLKIAPLAAEKSKAAGQRILVTCGKQDELGHRVYTQNRNFLETAKKLPLNLTYREWDGSHEWKFWDRSIAEFIGFIDKSDYGAQIRSGWEAQAGGFEQ